jgi:hypothetical protein
MLEEWLNDWRVRVNETKSVQITFTNRKIQGIPYQPKTKSNISVSYLTALSHGDLT